MLDLAERMSRAKPSALMAAAEKAKQLRAQGREVISFSIGVPNFLPGQHVYDAAAAALETDSGQYGSNRGPDALLDAFIEHMRQIGLTGYERRNCVTGDGAKHVLYNLFEALLNEGDGISFPVPYWTSYIDIAQIVGARVDADSRFGRTQLQDHPAAARRSAGEEAESVPVQQSIESNRHGLRRK